MLAKIARPRPQSHDLAKNLLDVLGAKIDKVVVTDLQEDCYYAVIHLLDKGGVQYEIDSRPSDAIALALRFDCPIFVEPCAPSKSERAPTAPSSRSFANNLHRRPAKERPAERAPILHACALAFLVRA